ncbi:MAG: PPOX class F420-dependent oxidoreductase [Micromonosporaceae bacterium]|nr:PPOX class F420-dependent oxidoreductase [Micromonosporaceae bacterium]
MTDAAADALVRLGNAQYVLLTTFRKDGRAVPTPVWVVRDGEHLAIWTARDSGKVKRVRRNGDVLIGPCDVRGRLTGAQVPARATVLDASGTVRVKAALARKYGLLGRLTLWGSRLRRGAEGTVAVRITLT